MFGRLQGLSKSAASVEGGGTARRIRPASMPPTGSSAPTRAGCGDGSTSPAVWWSDPRWRFLDEPTTGLDPRSRQSIWDLVGEFKNAGIATLLTTQYLEEADALSDRIIVDRSRYDHRGGHRRRAQGAHRRHLLRDRAAGSERSARHRRRAGSAVAREEQGSADTGHPTASRCRRRTARTRWPRPCGGSTAPTSNCATSRCGDRRSTRCSWP